MRRAHRVPGMNGKQGKPARAATRKRTVIAALLAFAVTSGLLALAPSAAQAQNQKVCLFYTGSGTNVCGSSMAEVRDEISLPFEAVVVAKIYDWYNYNSDGPVLHVYAPRGCTAPYTPIDAKLPLASLGWNNRATSVETFNSCDIKLYDQVDYEGAASTWIDSYRHLKNLGGGWDNRAGSAFLS
jgi:hypothetical protein